MLRVPAVGKPAKPKKPCLSDTKALGINGRSRQKGRQRIAMFCRPDKSRAVSPAGGHSSGTPEVFTGHAALFGRQF
ncbi:MAG: hypothetical protein ABSG42_05200 [Nitrospirota bacterium]